MILSAKEATEAYITASVAKSKMPTGRMIGKSMLAGMMIGMGAAGSNVAAHAITNVGLARLVAAVVFPVGLMMVILLAAELFTGDCLVAMAIPAKKVSVLQFVRILVVVFIGNLLGAALFTWLVMLSGQWDYSSGLLGAYTIKIAVGKVNLSFGRALASGILCNILVSAAVLMATCAKDVTGKLFVSFFVIMLFVTSGYEHCVANMYYITAGLLAKMDSTYVDVAMQQYGMTATQLDSLNLYGFFVTNLIPVTLGNIIGGSACVGLPVYLLNRDKTKKDA
ncbi:MAG: formate/nitrite transporter family protein [Wujia sp.]